MNSHKIKRILSLVSALVISAVSGTLYVFSAYSTSVAERLGFNSKQINTIGSSGIYGLCLFTPLFGYIINNYPSRIIPVLASVTIFTGYFCLAMTYQGYFESKSFLLCSFYMFLIGVSSSVSFLSVLDIISANVKSFRGVAFGMAMALSGLTAFIFSQLNSFFFKEDTYHFLLFTAITSGTFIFAGSIFLVRLPPEESREEDLQIEPSPPSISTTDDEQSPLLSGHKEIDDIGGWELIRSIDAILFSFILFLIAGTGLMYVNNVGAIVKSLYPSTSTNPLLVDERYRGNDLKEIQKFQNLHVGLFSIFSCFGRIIVGLMSDLAKNMYNTRRTWFLLVSSLCLFIGQILAGFIIEDLSHLWTVTIFVGFGYGTFYGIGPAITSELFGSKRLVSNWGFFSYPSALGGQLFNFLFGYNFDLHGNKCSGANCYNSAFYFSAIGCALSISIVYGLLKRRPH